MLRRIAEIRRVHLARPVPVLSREDELTVLGPEQVADAAIALEDLLRVRRREWRFPDVEVIATCGTTASPPTTLGIVCRRIGLCRARRCGFLLQIVQSLAVRQPTEVALRRIHGSGRARI